MPHFLLPLLHTGGPYPSGWLNSDWRPEPTVIIGIFALIGVYLWFTGPKNRDAAGERINPVTGKQQVLFVTGSLVALIALNPPLDDWADRYLLSAHMFQHLLLMFVTATFWLMGTPDWLLRRLVSNRIVNRIGYLVTRPVPALFVSSALIAFWHMPPIYDAALNHQPIHIIQHVSFIIASIIAWWPVIGPLPEWPKLSPPMQCLYLFAVGIPGSIVGAFITLSRPGLYDPYTQSPRIFGLDLATDQEIAGLTMWVLASVIYLLVITVIFFKWAGAEEAKEVRGNRSTAPKPAESASSRLPDPSAPAGLQG